MPHCDVQLYDNLLRENWTRGRLEQLVLIANRFSEYLDRCVLSQPILVPNFAGFRSAAVPCFSEDGTGDGDGSAL